MSLVNIGNAGQSDVSLPCSTSACLNHLRRSETRYGCNDKGCQSEASSVEPSVACCWGLRNIDANHGAGKRSLPGYVPPCTARLRYVDDQVWISATDCHACVEKQLCEVYPKGVQFSPTSNGTNKAEWLDIVVKLELDGTLDLCPKKPELEWVRDPDVPCGRHLGAAVRKVACLLTGRCSEEW